MSKKEELYLDLLRISRFIGYFAKGVEFLDNPSFEDGEKGWIIFGDGTYEIIDGRVKGKALRLKPQTNKYVRVMCEQMFPAIPRHAIHWTFWTRLPTGGAIQAFVQFYDSKKEEALIAYPCPLVRGYQGRYEKVYYGPITEWTPFQAYYEPSLDDPGIGWYTVGFPSFGAAYFRIGFHAWTGANDVVDIDDVHLYLSDFPQVNLDRKIYVRKSVISGGKILWDNKSVSAGEVTEGLWIEEYSLASVIIRVDAATDIYLEVSLDGYTWFRKAGAIKSFTAAGEDIVDIPVSAPIWVRFVSSSACTITLILMLKG